MLALTESHDDNVEMKKSLVKQFVAVDAVVSKNNSIKKLYYVNNDKIP